MLFMNSLACTLTLLDMQLYKYLDFLHARQKNDIFPVHLFYLRILLPTNYPRESATSFCSPHLPTWVGSTHGLWVCGFKKDTSIQELFAKNHRGPLPPPPSGARAKLGINFVARLCTFSSLVMSFFGVGDQA